jgi:predicted RNA methylase
MVASPGGQRGRLPRYEEIRESLLGCNALTALSADALVQATRAIHGRVDSFKLYNRSITQLLAQEFTILGRTVMECSVDDEARPLAHKIAAEMSCGGNQQECIVADLFLGSGNLGFHLSRTLRPSAVIGFEMTPEVAQATVDNLFRAGTRIQVTRGSYERLLEHRKSLATVPSVFLVDPPWGDAFDPNVGLDLNGINPSIESILKVILDAQPMAGSTVVFKTDSRNSLADVASVAANFSPVSKITPRRLSGVPSASFHIIHVL